MVIRKQVAAQDVETSVSNFIPVEERAHVSYSSEHPDYPVEGALTSGSLAGWRAAGPGKQRLRIHFDEPQAIASIHLVFEESEQQRTQEFLLRWSGDRGATFHSIVRQQFCFSPTGATQEMEEYRVNLTEVTDLDLEIIPDISNGPAVASLRTLRLR
jgi:hypothetical protein